jgi:hypothetical protein
VLHLVPQNFRGVQALGQDCKQATDRVQLVGMWAYTQLLSLHVPMYSQCRHTSCLLATEGPDSTQEW